MVFCGDQDRTPQVARFTDRYIYGTITRTADELYGKPLLWDPIPWQMIVRVEAA
jgi:hypothetical protein